MLFGAAGILFEFSSLWDVSWWWWHILRAIAYAAAFLVGFYGAFVSGLALTVVLFATVGRFDARLHRPLCWVAATALAGFGVVQIVHSVRTLGV